MTRTRRVAVPVTAGLLATVAACSPAGPAPGRTGTTATVPSSATAASQAVTSSTAPAPSSSPAATATASTRPNTPTGSAVVAGSSSAPRSTCTSVGIRVIRGSAAPGYEFAALQFTNTGTARCVLNGYPSVTLRRGGTVIGSVSVPAGQSTSTFTLAPGDTAESRLRDYSDCSAPLSDEIVVTVPGSDVRTSRPAQLRACSLRVYPLAQPD